MMATPAHAQKRKKHKEQLSIYDIDTLIKPIPIQRRMWQENKIDRAQRQADAADGKVDGSITYAEDEKATSTLTQAIITDVNQLQVMIENLPFPNAKKGDNEEMQSKIRYLAALNELMRIYNTDNSVEPVFYKKLVANFKQLVIARHENRLMEFVQANADIYTLTNKDVLDGFPEETSYIYTEMGRKEPVKMLARLPEFAKYPYADETIKNAAPLVPQQIYNYASSTNYMLSNAIRRNKDPLVQTIVRITQESKSPLKAMAFLSDIYKGRKTIAEIDQITANYDLFYKNMVRLKLEGDTLGNTALTSELAYRGLKYVRDMNDLHESPDAVRFKGIEGFKPEELYFIMVYGQDEIYTSSFVGTFKRLLQRMDTAESSDMLFEKVHYEKFRTFIRMCAGYNTLSSFLSWMDEQRKITLMKGFIANLDKGTDDELEDAVDVADAFGSINDEKLSTFLQQEVKKNYELSYKHKSKKGMRVYALLATLFNGLKASDNQDAIKEQSEILNLPPINLVQNKSLCNDSGVIYQQVFFYGDEDGRASYASFLGDFKDGKWKKVDSKYWTTISSTSGKKIVIYANLPLAEPEDEEAQKQLAAYLEKNEIYPTIIIHRGHSYHLPLTIDHLSKNTKIVVLGSCGGYHNLATVLDRSPDAHIISSKQTGAMNVNEPIIKGINDRLLAGESVNWISLWKDLDVYFNTKLPSYKDTFMDYVPPHRNLGAIFIKAYRRLVNNEVE